MKNSFLIRDGDSLQFIIFDDGIMFSLLLLSCSLQQQQQQQQLANLSVAQKEEEKRREERRGEDNTDPTGLLHLSHPCGSRSSSEFQLHW
jgi:hypothetical protein